MDGFPGWNVRSELIVKLFGCLKRYLPGAQIGVAVFELVPDGLEDGGKWSDSDAGSDQHADLIVEDVLTGCAKRSINSHSEEKQHEHCVKSNMLQETNETWERLEEWTTDNSHMVGF